MPTTTQQNLEQSLSLLKSGAPLHQKDIFNITWGFVFHSDPDRFLLETNAVNEKLAETLLIYRRKLLAAKTEEEKLSVIIDEVLLHYIVNTKGLIPEAEGEDAFEVFEAATRYAKTLNVEVVKLVNGGSLLRLNGKEILCPNWTVMAGWSAAWSLRQVGPVINRARYGRDDVIPSTAFGFDSKTTKHNFPNAMFLADCSHLAYFNPEYIEAQVQLWGYDAFRWIEDAKTDTQAFVAAKADHFIVCFRGTGSGTDWLIDARMIKTQAFGGRGRVHRGFKSALDSVWSKVEDAVKEIGGSKKIFVTGHSLGAALAQLAAYRFALLDNNRVAAVYVYGSPRVGNREFKEVYNELLETKTFLHINHKDIVTQVPPGILGYYHLGHAPRVFDIGHQITHPAFAETELDSEERELEALDATTQAAIQQQLEAAKISMEATTRFLNTPPDLLQTGGYDTTFNTGRVDDHSMDQYLFKFACAHIEEEWKRIGQSR